MFAINMRQHHVLLNLQTFSFLFFRNWSSMLEFLNILFLWSYLTYRKKNWENYKNGPKKTLKSPLYPLRVKCWGQKHIGSSYFCELSLHTEFQSPSTSPSGRKVTTWKKEERRENNDENLKVCCNKNLLHK